MNIFDMVIVQPTLNMLMAIYALIPGGDFGISVIIFTILIRLLLWPMVKKQLHQVQAMRKMQPELAKIKKKYGKNRQAQAMAMMELYKKHNVSMFGSIGLMLVQLPILIGIYRVVQIFVLHRDELAKYTYDVIEQWQPVKHLLEHPDQFNQNFLGMMDLTKQAVGQHGVVVSLLIVAIVAARLQYFLSKQLSPTTDSKRRLRDVLAEAGQGKEADQGEINAIVMRKMMLFMPVMLFMIMISLPGALALYMATSNAVAYVQNHVILQQYHDGDQPARDAVPHRAAQRAKQAKEATVTRIKAKD